MSLKIPIVRRISWPAVLPQFLALFLAIIVAHRIGGRGAVAWGAAAYLIYSLGSRRLIPRDHNDGISLVRAERFDDAIPKFRDSLAFFDRHAWIDDYRSIVLMSPSAASYREMALANIGFCYSQLGEGQRSREAYRECLRRFPGSALAISALRMLEAGES